MRTKTRAFVLMELLGFCAGKLVLQFLPVPFLSKGCKSVAVGMNAMYLRRGITLTVDAVVTNLKSRARMISTSEEIAQVGTISANGEREIGELIAKAMEKSDARHWFLVWEQHQLISGHQKWLKC
ncbi:hypothetical protein F8388_001058 [Cannabis sativa]|uniref:Uncharacterized protein n=1 Tax=Cannabis sativa TaxID=3483 RepID=A0A7J6ED70_CANSA|nr:hypothetical protein F8388_001058 [Cannabis sativa]